MLPVLFRIHVNDQLGIIEEDMCELFNHLKSYARVI
jgi:hypothetical protein